MLDVHYRGRPGLVGAWLSGDALIDCGPGSCVERLLEGLGDRVPRALLLTHVHLDHAGAAGALVERFPDMQVYVHPRGAPHVIDPSRLLASARRVYGDELDTLLGEVRPVPTANVHELDDGQHVEHLSCAFTPGHASHHVAFFDAEAERAFAGDLAGVRLAAGPVVPPTPPPDIDLPSWLSSLKVLEAWQPRTLALAHYGSVEDPRWHIAQLREALPRHARWAAEGDERFARALHDYLSARMDERAVEDYGLISMVAQSAAGLRRWLERADPGVRAQLLAPAAAADATPDAMPPAGARK